MMPPLRTPSKASVMGEWLPVGLQLAELGGVGRRRLASWLSIRRPCSFAGPHPKQRDAGL